jgi:hypothetical protein
MLNQFEGSLAPKKLRRDAFLFLGPAIALSAVLIFVGPSWLAKVIAGLDVLFAFTCLAATVVALGFLRQGRRALAARGLALYGVCLIVLVGEIALLVTR